MSANETHIIKFDSARSVVLMRIIVKKLFFCNHGVTEFCFVMQRDHWKLLLQLG
jgi:hypothetical protein